MAGVWGTLRILFRQSGESLDEFLEVKTLFLLNLLVQRTQIGRMLVCKGAGLAGDSFAPLGTAWCCWGPDAASPQPRALPGARLGWVQHGGAGPAPALHGDHPKDQNMSCSSDTSPCTASNCCGAVNDQLMIIPALVLLLPCLAESALGWDTGYWGAG